MNTTTEELTPEMVADFVAERQEMIGDAGVVKAGIYKFPNSNQVSIDLSVVVPETSREQALEFARLAGQESLFDLATFENIKTGATGENPMSFSPEQHREISKALKEGRMPNVFGTTAETTNNLLTKENIKEVEIKQTTPKNKLIVKAAKMVLNAIPGVKIYMHNNGQEMASAIEVSKKELTKEEKTGLTESSGLYVDGDIHINLESATIGTVYHEAFHALIEKNGMKSGSILLMAKGLKNIISDKGVKQRLDDFVSQYNEDEKAEEYISELGGILSEAEQELTTTKLQQFKTLINNIAKKLGLPVIFSASATAQDAADFINTMSKKLRTGKEIKDLSAEGKDGKIKRQVEKLFLGETPKFKSLDDVSKYIQSWVNENKLFDKSIEEVSDQVVIDKFSEHVLNEIRAWESIKGSEYVGFYNEDIPQRLNPELQKFAKQRYGRELTGEEVSLYHMVSAFASPSADPHFDSSKGLEVFDKYMMTGNLSAYGTEQATIWGTDSKGKRYDTGKLKFDEKGNPVYKQVAKAYATTSLEKFNNIVNNFNGDVSKAVNWVLSNHSFDDASKMMGKPTTGAKANQLDENEYFTKENGGTGVFAITGAKLGSYILNRIGDYSTVTKDMWYARTLARLAGESLTEKGKAIKSPWASNTKQGLRKRKLADKAFEIVAKKLGTSPADVQQKIWDFEKRLYEKLGAVEKTSYASDGLKSKAKQILSQQQSKIKTAEEAPSKIKFQKTSQEELPLYKFGNKITTTIDQDKPISVLPLPERFMNGYEEATGKKITQKDKQSFLYKLGRDHQYKKGGVYIDISNLENKNTINGYVASSGEINIDTNTGKPSLSISENILDTEKKSTGRIIKTNLFKKKAGWDWNSDADKSKYNKVETLVSVEIGSKHVYTLGFKSTTPIQLKNYSESKSEPRLRPTTNGQIFLGNYVGDIKIRGKRHPVYDSVYSFDQNDYQTLDRLNYKYLKPARLQSFYPTQRDETYRELKYNPSLTLKDRLTDADQYIFDKLGIKNAEYISGGVEASVYDIGMGRVIRISKYPSNFSNNIVNKKIEGVIPVYSTGKVILPKRMFGLEDYTGQVVKIKSRESELKEPEPLYYSILKKGDSLNVKEDLNIILNKLIKYITKTLDKNIRFTNSIEDQLTILNEQELDEFKNNLDDKQLKDLNRIIEIKNNLKKIGVKERDSHTGNYVRNSKGDLEAVDLQYIIFDEGSEFKRTEEKNVIKLQKTTQETRMDSEAEAIFKKSLDRGVAWNDAIQNVIDYIQISKWYEEASDIDREQKIRDFIQSKNQKLKEAPSVAKIMGTPKPTMVTVKEKTALKDQIKLEARAAREAKVDLNEKRKLLSTAIKGLVKLGKLNTRQAGIIIERAGYVNLDNQAMVDRLAEYAAKVFEKADYQDRLSRAFSFREGIRELLKGDIQTEVVGMAKKFSKIDPSMVDDIEKYLEMAEIVKNAIKPSKVNKKDLDVSMRESMNIDSVSEFTNDAIENQEAILKEELLAVHSELVEAGVIDDKMSLSEIELTINSLKEKEDNANYKADILTFLSKRIDTMSAIIKDILIFKINPMTGEKVALTEKNIDLISRMLNIDINNVSIKEAIFIAEAMDNFINNNITSSVEAVIEKHEGATELENLIADKVVASPLRKYFSTYAGQLFSEQVASMPILFEKLFVGAKKGLMVAKKMGWTALINGVNKAEKMFNTTVDAYFKQYSKTKPNGKSFNDAENVYERGMLAFLSRNVSGTITQQAEELKRRVEVLKESVKSLLEGSTKEQKMGELYQKVYGKLNVESGDIDVIHANADKINRSAVGWWINQWGTTYNDLSDISLSVYNTVLSSDTSYTTDRYKLLGKSTSKEIIDPKTGSFGRDIEFLDKNKAGVMMPSTKPSASAVSNASRYISLDFDVNNTSAYKGALIDINTAAAIRRIDGFINSKNLAKLIPTEEDRDIFTGRIADYIQAAKNKMPLQSDKMRLLDQLTNFLGGIGVAKALGGIDQVVKQTLPIALSTFVNSGRFDLVMPGSSASVWIDSLGMAISNRGQESQSTIESVDRRLEKASGLIDKSTNAFVDVQQFWLKYFLSKPDLFIAKSSFISYYKQYLSNNNKSTDIDWATHNVNQDAADYAMLMVDRQQNVSDAKMAGKIFSSQDSTKKIMRKIFLPFASFSLNQKSRMVSDIKVLGINSGASKQDKMIALRSLASLPFEMALYQSMSLAIRLGYLAIAKGIIGAVADDDDEEKERLLGMEISKELKNATKYPLRSLITDFLSPAPVLDNLVVGGANALLRQSEDKEMIDDAVDKKNLMLNISGKEKMDDDEKEKFIKKFKKDHEYQLFNDEQKSWGTIGIGIDLYTEIMDNAKTAYTGKYTQDYMGNESERFLLPKDQDNIKNAVIFETLFALGILPRDVNTISKNIIKLSKKNSLTENQFEKYKAVGKETGGKVTGWKMDLVESKSKTESTLEELEWIKGYGGLTEKQGQEYVKLKKLIVGHVSYTQLMDLKSGMTADKIIKSY